MIKQKHTYNWKNAKVTSITFFLIGVFFLFFVLISPLFAGQYEGDNSWFTPESCVNKYPIWLAFFLNFDFFSTEGQNNFRSTFDPFPWRAIDASFFLASMLIFAITIPMIVISSIKYRQHNYVRWIVASIAFIVIALILFATPIIINSVMDMRGVQKDMDRADRLNQWTRVFNIEDPTSGATTICIYNQGVTFFWTPVITGIVIFCASASMLVAGSIMHKKTKQHTHKEKK